MNKKLVVIIPNELEMKNLSLFVTLCKSSHLAVLKEFIYNTGIELSEDILEHPDKTSKALAEQGLLIMLTDEFDNTKEITVYLPLKTSPKQLDYFEKRKGPLQSYNISLSLKKEDGHFEIIDKTNADRPIIDILIDKLKERLVEKGKTKTLTPTNNKNF